MENQVSNEEATFAGTKQEVLSKFEALLDSQTNGIAGGSPPEYSINLKLTTAGGGGAEIGFGVKF